MGGQGITANRKLNESIAILLIAHEGCQRSYFFAKRDSFGNFPIRIAAGVTSTNSPGTMYSTASSRVSCIGGVVEAFSSAPAERMFVSCFALQTLTFRSFSLAWIPTIWSSYTSSPGDEKSAPRSCTFVNAKGVAIPVSKESRLPRVRPPNSPANGLYPAKVELITASPRVAESSLDLTPFIPRAGTSYWMVTEPSAVGVVISSMFPFRSFNKEIADPEYSSGSSMSTSSNGSQMTPSISFLMT
mmetsp:Transcript_31922/g.79503  ORF Transcript_31922/g.79503 Transcript_31922/m.79503 type:complete len:244 (-) Transcript_31922:735-1466(-)